MLSDHTYDLIAALADKSEAVIAFETYLEDAEEAGDQTCANLWRTLKQREEEAIEMLRGEVERHAKDGTLH